MDCHLPSTHFTLLAYFKEPDYNELFDQLFNYEGDCVWTDDEYKFMQQNHEIWPDECTATGYSDKYNNSIYMDVKPAAYGDLDIGFYIDELCLYESTDRSTLNANQIFKGIDSGDVGDWTLDAELEQWNSAFDVFKQCLPCKTGALTELISGQAANVTGDRYSAFNNYTANNAASFQCHGDLNDDVNQCMQFATHTRMRTAYWTEVASAAAQGTLTSVSIKFTGTTTSGNSNANVVTISDSRSIEFRGLNEHNYLLSWIILLSSAILFGSSLYKYKLAGDVWRDSLAEPFVSCKGEIS